MNNIKQKIFNIFLKIRKTQDDKLDYYKATEIIGKNYISKDTLEKIAVLIFDVATLYRFNGILKHLEKNSFDIVYNYKDPAEIIEFSKHCGYSYRSMSSVLKSRNIYNLTLSHNMWFAWSLDNEFLPNLLGKHHIRLIYSLGASNEVLSSNHNYIYDTILCYGPYQKEILERNSAASIIEVGNPRLDTYFNNSINIIETKKHYNLNDEKKTIVWMPTVLPSSIKDFINIVEILSDEYNLLVNIHPLIDREDLEVLSNSKIKNNVIKTNNNIDLFAIADFIVCDYGGAAFSAIYLNKNILLFDLPNAECVDILGKDSAEFYIRKYIPGFNNTKAIEIMNSFKNKKYWEEQEKIREQLFDIFFADYRGFSSYYAAKTIKKIMKCNID